jgi:lysophospholipase L1-like esterase
VIYLALGDSLTFGVNATIGEDPATQPSSGDQGFVADLADRLVAYNGGIRPKVVNLGVYAETSGSLVTGTPPIGWTKRNAAINSAYQNASDTQLGLMQSQIAAIHAAGDTVGYATFMIGVNDIFYTSATPAFVNGTPAEQQQLIAATIAEVQNNYLTVLTTLTSLAPEAQIFLPTYYNPYPSGYEPQHTFYNSILAGYRLYVQADAQAFGATMVDLAPLFAGNELTLTNIGNGDIHPTALGYTTIGQAIVSTVPEPSGMTGATIGLLTAVAIGWRRRSKAVRAA